MAAVPEWQRQKQLRPTNQTAERVSTTPDTFGAGVGRAMGQAAEGVYDAAEALDFRQSLTEDADGRAAFNKYRYDQKELLKTPETGYLNRTGENALDTQRQAERDLKDLRERHAQGLSPRARKKYNDLVDGMQDQAHGQLLTHTSNESRNYITNQRKSTIEGYLEEAATNWNDDALFDENLGRALAEQNELATLQGWDPATRKQGAENLVSGALKGRIVQAAAVDPLVAQELLDNSRDALNAADEHALDTNLKALVIEAKADAVVNKFIVRGGNPDGSGSVVDPYAASIDRAESGGNPYAANNPDNPGYASADGTKSSALGLRQYLRGTYLKAVSDMRKQGLAAWADGMTEAEIAQTRTNPAIEGSVHNFVRQQNQSVIRSAGYDVTPTTEYAIHHFGPGGGIALLNTARTNPGASAQAVLGDAVIKANPQFKGLTVAQALDWVSNHIGADDSSGGSGAFFDAEAAFREAMAIEDPEVRDAALKKINSLQAMQASARASAQQEAQAEAWNIYTETGRTDLGVEMKQRMGQGGWTTFMAAVANDRQGIDTTDPATWDFLTELSSRPDEFAKVNLEAHRPNLSQSDWRTFFAQQQAAKEQIDRAPFEAAQNKAALPYAKLHGYAEDIYRGVVDDTAKEKMSQEERLQRVAFERELNRLIGEFFDREKREPGPLEVQEMAWLAVAPTTYTPAGSRRQKDGFMFQLSNRADGTDFQMQVEYESILTAERTRLANVWLDANPGADVPPPDAIAELYEQEMLLRNGVPPNVGIDDVPMWLVREEMAADPTATPEDMVEQYQLFILHEYRSNPERALRAMAARNTAGPSIGDAPTMGQPPAADAPPGPEIGIDEPPSGRYTPGAR